MMIETWFLTVLNSYNARLVEPANKTINKVKANARRRPTLSECRNFMVFSGREGGKEVQR